jgi:4-hydroxy-3-methylbut-2-enyl diphosphate reductase
MQIVKIAPRGYCYGVVDAMVKAIQTARDQAMPRPIYILGMIVHNQHVTEALEQEGVITLDGKDRLAILAQIDHGTVIFTAHGVSPQVRAEALAKGLTVVDATCPDVTKTHDLIRTKVAEGYEIIYIGKHGHPEPEGALGCGDGHVYLIEQEAEIADLAIDPAKPIFITNQTTMSQWDIRHLITALQARYPHAEHHMEICMATQVRQEAVAAQAGSAEVCIVVGDPRSNNSARLAQVAEEIAHVPAHRIADLGELDITWLQGKERVAVTAGASTPTPITKEVIGFLEQFDTHDPATWELKRTIDMSRLLPMVRV